MNKQIALFLLAFVFLLNLPGRATAQADFAPIGATWYYDFIRMNYPQEGNTVTGVMIQESVADTVIQGKAAHMLVRKFLFRGDNNDILAFFGGIDFVYANTDTVFYFNEQLNRFLPLYIFNVQAGDTMLHRALPEYQVQGADTIWRIAVDSVLTRNYNNQPVKVVYTSANHDPSGSWDDGVAFKGPYCQYFGLTEGHLTEYNTLHPLGVDFIIYKLRCYQDAIFDVHFGDLTVACDSVPQQSMSISDIDFLSRKLSVYPNPATDQVTIALDGIAMQSVEVLDMLGRRVFIQEYKAGISKTTADLSNVSKGTYILRINTKDKGSVHRKIVLK